LSHWEIDKILIAGGLSAADVVSGEFQPARYSPLGDPREARPLWAAMADALGGKSFSRVVVGEDQEDVLVGYSVGQELGLPITQVVESQGQLYILGAIEEGDRVVVAGEAFRHEDTLRALVTVVENAKATVAAVAALVDTHALQAVCPDAVALWSPSLK
jgi:adenine/guanine phosphoribosyltransferase-like PRPP-binding protein